MVVTIRKIGNSRGIVIPYQILERLGLEENDELDIVEVKDGIDIRIRKKEESIIPFAQQMEQLYGRPIDEIVKTEKWDYSEYDWGEPVEKEVW